MKSNRNQWKWNWFNVIDMNDVKIKTRCSMYICAIHILKIKFNLREFFHTFFLSFHFSSLKNTMYVWTSITCRVQGWFKQQVEIRIWNAYAVYVWRKMDSIEHMNHWEKKKSENFLFSFFICCSLTLQAHDFLFSTFLVQKKKIEKEMEKLQKQMMMIWCDGK